MNITRKQWDAIRFFSVSMHSVFYTEKHSENGVLTIDRIIENGHLQDVFNSGLSLDQLKTYMESAVKKGGGIEFGSPLNDYIPDFKKILDRFEVIKKKGGYREGAGAKSFSETRDRAVKVWGKRLYEDQCHFSAEYVRQALDLNEILVNALGNPHFSPEKIIELLTPQATDGSVIALIGILADVDERAKRLYLL